MPVALAIVALLALLVVSYRQVVDATRRPADYVVSRDNFGNVTAAVAGAALLIDYVLTVAVSVSGNSAAMSSVWPDQLGPLRVEISVAFVVLLAWGNLRGIREAGRIFAVPTYVYVVSVGTMIVAGIWRLASGDLGAITYSPERPWPHHAGRHRGRDRVPAPARLRRRARPPSPASRPSPAGLGAGPRSTPRKTLMVMAAIMAALFLGITCPARAAGGAAVRERLPTSSPIARAVLGDGPAFLLVQAATLLILVLAANTAFSGSRCWPASPPATPCCPGSSASEATASSTPTASSPCRWPSS